MPVPAFRALSGARASGAPLPEVPALQALYRLGCRPRLGQMTMIAGQPGSQKSGLTMWLVAQLALPTLYFSLDMAQSTAFIRMASIATGETGDQVTSNLAEGYGDWYADELRESPVHFCFDTEADMDDVASELDAWVEMYDDFPKIIVIDNLMDLVGGGESEHESHKEVLKELKALARVTGAAIFVLHHMSEGIGNAAYPSPRKALQQKVAQTPEVVLSVALDGDAFRISPVKNRNGRQFADATEYAVLRADPARTAFYARS